MTFLVRCWRCDVVRWSDHQGLDLRSAGRAVRQSLDSARLQS
jgi:hypothetical protein